MSMAVDLYHFVRTLTSIINNSAVDVFSFVSLS